MLLQVDRFETGRGDRKILVAVDVWIQCTKAGLLSILDENDGDINHVNSLDQDPRIWMEGSETKGPRQWRLKEIPREKLDDFFVQRG